MLGGILPSLMAASTPTAYSGMRGDHRKPMKLQSTPPQQLSILSANRNTALAQSPSVS